MRRQGVLGFIVLLVLIILYSGLIFIRKYEYEFYYYPSPDKKHFITRVEHKPLLWGYSTFFTRGYYKELSKPKSFIRPVYSGRDGGFTVLLHWEGSKCIIYAPYGKFETARLDSSFNFRETNPYLDKIWREMEVDTLKGNNLFLTEYKFNKRTW